MNSVCPIAMVLHGIAVPLVAGSDFVGGESTLTLLEGPSTISCVGVGTIDGRLFEFVEDFAFTLYLPILCDEAAVGPGPSLMTKESPSLQRGLKYASC